MGSAAIRTICRLALIGLSLSTIVPNQAGAQGQTGCHTLKIGAGGFLEQCGDKLRSFTLLLQDIRRVAEIGPNGGFYFGCPIESMCDQVEIAGWFINEKNWASSARDAKVISEVLQQAPMVRRKLDLSQSACDVFDVEIAGLAGRAACYVLPDSSLVVVVAADADIGIAVAFRQQNTAWEELRNKAITMVPRFSLERASGDATLMRWMR